MNDRADSIPFATVLGVRVSALTKAQTLAWIERWIRKGAKKMVVTPNPEQVVMAQKDRSFRTILNHSPLALCDGEGLLWASRFLGVSPSLPERVTGEEVMQELVLIAVERGWRVFLLGGKPGVAGKAADIFKSEKFVGRGGSDDFKLQFSSGARDIQDETNAERRTVLQRIHRFKPHILFVAYGAPWQEQWVARNLSELDVSVAMVVGGALDMTVDPTLRPPGFVRRMGLDWFYRLVRQPWRIRRQLALLTFIFLVFLRKTR